MKRLLESQQSWSLAVQFSANPGSATLSARVSEPSAPASPHSLRDATPPNHSTPSAGGAGAPRSAPAGLAGPPEAGRACAAGAVGGALACAHGTAESLAGQPEPLVEMGCCGCGQLYTVLSSMMEGQRGEGGEGGVCTKGAEIYRQESRPGIRAVCEPTKARIPAVLTTLESMTNMPTILNLDERPP